jgi:hypothetical protein
MKHLVVAFFAALILMCACSQKKGGDNTLTDAVDSTTVAALVIDRYSYVDSGKYANVNIEIELPKAENDVAAMIRSHLLDLVGEHLSYVTSYESERSYPLYSGNSDDEGARLEYYFKETMLLMDTSSTKDVNDRIRYIDEDSTLTPVDKALAKEYIPRWSYEYKLVKVTDTLTYAVFLSQDYIYMGGAHGGVGGEGYITFDKRNGHAISQFVDTARVADMQPLLVEGLIQYYVDAEQPKMTADELFERLQLPFDGPKNQIPLPVGQPCPTNEGLSFTYGQYEIACYADGMPSFVIPYEKIKPFLTEEAAQLLRPYLK